MLARSARRRIQGKIEAWFVAMFKEAPLQSCLEVDRGLVHESYTGVSIGRYMVLAEIFFAITTNGQKVDLRAYSTLISDPEHGNLFF